jgi:hypothetical protein
MIGYGFIRLPSYADMYMFSFKTRPGARTRIRCGDSNKYKNRNTYNNMSDNENKSKNVIVDNDEDRQALISNALQSISVSDTETKKPESTPTPKKTSKFAAALRNKASSTKAEPVQSANNPVAQSSTATPPPSMIPNVVQGTSGSANGFSVGGRIVGSAAKEPELTKEQRQLIETRRAYRLPVISVNESRRAEPDPQEKYVRRNPNGTVTATGAAMLPNLPLNEFMLAIGTAKADTKLKPAMYSDVIIVGRNRDWTLSQWVIRDVIMEPVPADVRKRGMAGPTRQAKRTIGHHFARFGLPIISLGPVFETLAASMPGLMNDLSITDGYYWHNASWGVNASDAVFGYKGPNQTMCQTTQLNEAMEMLGMNSSMGVGTFAISVACEYEVQNGRPVPNTNKYKFSLKCHNFYHMKKTDFHGPPQTTAVGFSLSDELANESEVLSRPAAMGTVLDTTESLFGGTDANPFMAAMAGINKAGPGNSQTTTNTIEGLL